MLIPISFDLVRVRRYVYSLILLFRVGCFRFLFWWFCFAYQKFDTISMVQYTDLGRLMEVILFLDFIG
jgi:hypothetical protein